MKPPRPTRPQGDQTLLWTDRPGPSRSPGHRTERRDSRARAGPVVASTDAREARKAARRPKSLLDRPPPSLEERAKKAPLRSESPSRRARSEPFPAGAPVLSTIRIVKSKQAATFSGAVYARASRQGSRQSGPWTACRPLRATTRPATAMWVVQGPPRRTRTPVFYFLWMRTSAPQRPSTCVGWTGSGSRVGQQFLLAPLPLWAHQTAGLLSGGLMLCARKFIPVPSAAVGPCFAPLGLAAPPPTPGVRSRCAPSAASEYGWVRPGMRAAADRGIVGDRGSDRARWETHVRPMRVAPHGVLFSACRSYYRNRPLAAGTRSP